MAFASLSRRDRRAVIAGGLLVSVVIVWLRLGPAWWGWTRNAREAATVAVAELEQARASVTTLPVTRDSLAARNARFLALAPAILSGKTRAAVGAGLAAVVSGAAAGAGLEVGTISIRPDTGGTAFFTRPLVRGDARGDIAGLTRFLLTVERGPLILVLRQLTISQPDPDAPADRAESLRVEFVVEALALESESVESRRVSERAADSRRRGQGERAP